MEDRGERGAIAVLAAFVLLVVIAFLALAINVGMLMRTRGQLQNASDAAALAAAGSLDGTTTGLASARQMAFNYSRAHQVTGEAVQIDQNADVHFGRWHFVDEAGFVARSFEEITNLARVVEIDAVKIANGRDQSGTHNTPLGVFFSGVLGRGAVNVGSQAVAVGRGGRMTAPCLSSCRAVCRATPKPS